MSRVYIWLARRLLDPQKAARRPVTLWLYRRWTHLVEWRKHARRGNRDRADAHLRQALNLFNK